MRLCLLIFLSVVALSFALVPAPLVHAARKVLDKSVVTVNDEVILQSDVDAFQKKIRSKSFQELFGGVDEKTANDPNKILQLLIEEKIINQQVKKLELSASDQEIDGQIRAIAKRNGITEAQLTDRLKQLGTTMTEYRDGIKRQIERKNLVDREIRPNMEISEEDLRHYYQRNAKPEDSETQFKVAQILIDSAPKGGVLAADRAKTVWKEVSAKPSEFEAAAKQYSDDSSNASTGGVLGYFSISQLAKEFRDAVKKTPVGQVTEPIKTAAGFHILKVLETRAGDFASLPKDRRDALQSQMQAEELEKRMGMWLERKKHEAFIRRADDKEYRNASK